MATDQALTDIRGKAPVKQPSVRVLAAAAAHNDCALSRLALASRTNLDKLCEGTHYAVDFGQDPQAFQRGNTFERLVKDEEKGYATLIALLRETLQFAPTDVKIVDLREGVPPNENGLKLRAARTKQLLKQIAQKQKDAPNIINGAVLTCRLAGQTAYFEADGLAAASAGKLYVIEIKSFPFTDGKVDSDKFGTALDQLAWYAALTRLTLIDAQLSPDVLSSDGLMVLARGTSLQPVMLVKNISHRITRALEVLQAAPSVEEAIKAGDGQQFPDPAMHPDKRVQQLEAMMDAVGTTYKPECLQDCGMARLCRARSHGVGATRLCGSALVRQLPGIRTLPRAIELSTGVKPAPHEVQAAEMLRRAAAVHQRLAKGGAL